MVIDKELNKQIRLKKECQLECEGLRNNGAEMERLLRAAAISDEKKTAMLDELKVAVREEREKMNGQKEELDKDKSQLDSYKSIKEEESLSLVR